MANDLVNHAELMKLPEKPNKTWALGFQEDEQEDIHMYPSSVGMESCVLGALPDPALYISSLAASFQISIIINW